VDNYIHPEAAIAEGVAVGHFVVIGKGVSIGKGSRIGNGVIIHDNSLIGGNVRIDDHAVIGKLPIVSSRSKLTHGGQIPGAIIGNDCLIGTGAVIYAGASIGKGVLIADYASVRENTKVGELTIIGRCATIDNHVKIGKRCKIQTNVYICAFSELEDDSFIAPCAAASNDNFAGRWKERVKYYKGVTVKKGGRIGVNATILPGKTIGQDGFAAAGSVVTKDIPDGTIVAGNPAKPLRPVPENQLIKNQEE
jgi:acetyltransferase-like isoleucine patch superfamily enzyme